MTKAIALGTLVTLVVVGLLLWAYWKWVRSNYVGSGSRDRKTHGAFPSRGRTQRFRDIVDGLSNTVFVGEITTPNGQNANQLGRFAGSKQGNGDMDPATREVRGRLTATDGSGFEQNRLPNANDTVGFTSNHAGGVQVLAGDGAVHFVSENIRPEIWQSPGTVRPWNNTGKGYTERHGSF